MAIRPILIKRPPDAVWAVLRDGRRYAEWVVGTAESVPLDADWPEVGSAIRYTVKVGPRRLSGRTVVRDHEPGRRLELEARSRLVGTARIGIEVRPWGEYSLVTIDEHPLTGPGGRLHNVASDFLLQLRHRLMLRRLAHVVESSRAAAPSGD
ncbi:SRPBCC family protein [Streptomyces litchfieldiae]|uniref:SRPBCC family protein n=1 Tax=Streptomyces litchfieldiae TaxID=3075543 RepID=A0ABU2MZX5_9ACTN|nr:SRPBCC family protein [Streptomyces sp. DSM 44938]MDT0346373.1 SRPBCC family protein [Streptomyces sp. DSM 44938]